MFISPSVSCSQPLRLHASSSQNPPSLAFQHNLLLRSCRPVSSLLSNDSNTYLQSTKIVPRHFLREEPIWNRLLKQEHSKSHVVEHSCSHNEGLQLQVILSYIWSNRSERPCLKKLREVGRLTRGGRRKRWSKKVGGRGKESIGLFLYLYILLL